MRVLLVNPPSRFWLFPPLGLAYVASVLRENNVGVKILDLVVDPQQSLARELRVFNPDFVGVTCTSQTFQSALEVAKTVKACSDSFTVFGGCHASSMPLETLKYDEVDIVVKGEGEIAMLKVCEGLNGVVYGVPMKIDDIPFPARDLLPMSKYDYAGSVLTSRGCPFSCAFCVHSVSGFVWRGRKPESVVEEIKLLVDDYGVRDIHVVDDNFSVNLKRAKKIMNLLIEENMDLSLWFYNGLRADRVDSELLSLMAAAGTEVISYGLETTDKTVLQNMGKKVSVEQVEDALRLTQSKGIKTRVSLMVGNMGDTFAKVLNTINWVKEASFLDAAEFSLCTAYPDTPLYEWVKKNGSFLTSPENNPTYFLDKGDLPSFETDDFRAEERVQALRIAQRVVERKFFFKRDWRNFKIRNIPTYVRLLVSLLTCGKFGKWKFKK